MKMIKRRRQMREHKEKIGRRKNKIEFKKANVKTDILFSDWFPK